MPRVGDGGSGTQHTPIELERPSGGDVPIEGPAALEPEAALRVTARGIVEDLLDPPRDRSRVEGVDEGRGVAPDLLERGSPRADHGQPGGPGSDPGQRR